MAHVPDDTKTANDTQPTMEIAHYQNTDSEKGARPESSEKASILECDVQDVTGASAEPQPLHRFADDMAVPEYSDEEYKKLKRRIDRYLLPLMWLCYGIQQTDKTSLGIQATFGLREVGFSLHSLHPVCHGSMVPLIPARDV